MRSPARSKGYRTQVSRPVTIPAPVGGLNDRDSLANMAPTDAVILENWWLNPSRLVTRAGCSDWVTGFTHPVETLMPYSPVTGSNKLFAVSNGSIYDATSDGAVGAAVVSGLSNSRPESVNITTSGGSFLYAFNGIDKPQLYDGATWTAIDGSSTPAITGVTTTLLKQACLYQHRLWMAEKNSLNLWYLDVDSIGGAATKIDFGSVFHLGGSIVGSYTWTIDAGNGMDDKLCILTSEGEVAVYSGYDPTTDSGFVLVGVFTIGRPIGQRPCIKYAGDLLVITETGVFPMSQGLLTASIDRSKSITDKIQNTISSAVSSYGSNFGWELCLYPQQNALVLNVPISTTRSVQYVQNTISKQWTKFTGWNAHCFVDTPLGFFYADATTVKKAWTGNRDSGVVIRCDVLQAFSTLGSPVNNKFVTMVKPYLQTSGSPSVLYGINFDYNPQDVTGVLSYSPPGVGMVWGSMTWGSMTWGGGMRQLSNWNSVGAIGKAVALRMKLQNNGASTEWAATDFVFQQGSIL